MKIVFFLHTLLTLNATAGPLFIDLQKKGFVCAAHPLGHICSIHSIESDIFHYSRPVAILIPSGVSSPENILLYLHGFRGGSCTPESASPKTLAYQFRLLDQLIEGGLSKSVILLPTSSGKCETYRRELVDQFASFKQWSLELLRPKTKNWRIAGHSGAGRIIAQIQAIDADFTENLHVSILLDATYGIPNRLEDWQKAMSKNPHLRVFSSYIPSTQTEEGSLLLKQKFPMQVQLLKVSDRTHCELPSTELAKILMFSGNLP